MIQLRNLWNTITSWNVFCEDEQEQIELTEKENDEYLEYVKYSEFTNEEKESSDFTKRRNTTMYVDTAEVEKISDSDPYKEERERSYRLSQGLEKLW